MSDGALAFAAAVRVVVGVHDRTANRGTDAEMSCLARLAYAHDFVLEVADLSYGGFALERYEAHFARRHLQSRISAFFCHNLSGNARGSRYLSASAGFEFYSVNDSTDGDVGKSKAVARLNVRARTGEHFVAGRKAYGSENVSLFAVRIRK